MIERRALGRTGLAVSVLGFGGSEIGLERVDVATVRKLVAGALDAGLNVIDTAECQPGCAISSLCTTRSSATIRTSAARSDPPRG